LALRSNVKITQLSHNKFKSISDDKNTQGIIAVKSNFNYSTVEEIISGTTNIEFPLIVLLDSIQDPHNLGAIIRTSECSGVNGIITTTRNSAAITNTVEKTSAGAISYMKISRVNNLIPVIETLKQNGYWIVGSKIGNSTNYSEIDYKQPIALVLGNEEKGIRRLISEKCDFLAEIPMKGKIQSLNVSVAAGIFLFEILRQRNT
jgi:23S rRNA (guanosine2251-2'-O)-methyltransferase